ncbi:MAG: hypothetical protein OJF50_000956 [Nitrospira sp.]|jgi:HK97 family phage prohead protease|nr:hypothetical protein [Nitrospira sp.]
MITKVFESAVKDVGPRKSMFTISTAATDRDGDTIDPNGWELDDYRRNPIVLWSHKHDQLPIAKSTRIWSTQSGLQAEIEWPERGVYPFADTVHDMVKSGFLNATSVGFVPKEATGNRSGGRQYSRASLLEFSIVPVPCNPETLVIQRGLNTEAVKSWLASPNTTSGVDWAGVNREPEINWHKINRELANQISVDPADVLLAIKRVEPQLRQAVRNELKKYAQDGARQAILYLTGRLD